MKFAIAALSFGLAFSNLEILWLKRDVQRLTESETKLVRTVEMLNEINKSTTSSIGSLSGSLLAASSSLDGLLSIAKMHGESIKRHNEAIATGTKIMRMLGGLPETSWSVGVTR